MDTSKHSRPVRFFVNRLRWGIEESRYSCWSVYDAIAARCTLSRSEVRRILLVAMNELGLRQFMLLREVFSDDSSVEFAVTDSPRGTANRALIEKWCRQHGLDYLPFGRARWRTWDLMIFADHDDMARFPVDVPKVRISHGIFGSKLVGGVPYRYDPKWIEYRRKVFYSRMFEPSEYAVECALSHNPKLDSIAVAVGDLSADRLLSLRPERDGIRAGFGYFPNDFVILLQSTYGATSLMESIGKALVGKCINLAEAKGWKFILQTHPHHWTGPHAVDHPYGQFLLKQEDKPGITVIHPDEDWAPHMIASDMVITDHTSLSMTYALLSKPTLFVDVPGTQLIEGNPGHRLAQILPKLSSVGNLAEDIKRARDTFPREQVAEIAKDILSYPGEAVERMRSELLGFLGLEVKDGVEANG